jgi:hypothetical protein
MPTRVLVLAAGEGSRWSNYRGTPKHLAVIDGEPVIHRTVRQFSSYASDIVVVGVYQMQGSKLYSPAADVSREMNKFDSSMDMWLPNGRTVIVFGDVYFTDEAVRTIMTNQDDWRFYLRPGPSSITGKDCKEIFAVTFDDSALDLLQSAVTKLRHFKTSAAGWSLFRLLTIGTPSASHTDKSMFNYGRHVVIDDWTEDFDYPRDLDNWEANRSISS